MDNPDEVIAMQLSCARCGRTVKNDLPRSQLPTHIEFNARLSDSGWLVDPNTRLCPKCVSSS